MKKNNWNVHWISEVFQQPSTSSMEEVIEYLSYDLGDLGGYLGWSLLSVALFIATLVSKIRSMD
jgi:hypothetical protein